MHNEMDTTRKPNGGVPIFSTASKREGFLIFQGEVINLFTLNHIDQQPTNAVVSSNADT